MCSVRWRAAQPTLSTAADSVLLTYICGNMFRVRNTSFEPREVRRDIYNAAPADTGSLRLRGRDVGAAHVDYFVTSRTKGTMRVFLGEVLRQTKVNGNCTLTVQGNMRCINRASDATRASTAFAQPPFATNGNAAGVRIDCTDKSISSCGQYR